MESANPEQYNPSESYLRVATATPEVAVGDWLQNLKEHKTLLDEAAQQDVHVLVFPELSLTGYTLGDLVQRPDLIRGATDSLVDLATYTTDKNIAAVVGLPVVVGNSLYNCAAVIADGSVQGLVPKQNLPNDNEFYEMRWYATWRDKDNITVPLGEDAAVPFGYKQLFDIDGVKLGVEVCEDLWAIRQPNVELAANGAFVIANPSASPEILGKEEWRRTLVAATAGRLSLAYIYSSAGPTESTAEVVMGGHAFVNENGHLMAERPPLSDAPQLLTTDLDIGALQFARRKNKNFPNEFEYTVADCHITRRQTDLRRYIDATPFIPKGELAEQIKELDKALSIQAYALAHRLDSVRTPRVTLGLSGGLDSTWAALVAKRTATIRGQDPKDMIEAVVMPGPGSSDRTQSNAERLAHAMGLSYEVLPIAAVVEAELATLGHDGTTQDIAFENVQARARTALLFNRANQKGGLVLGTGDLSEIALGWCTYNGDHMSGYNVNATVPKTLISLLVKNAARGETNEVREILEDILDTPISPELTKADFGEIEQRTEDAIGPYALHDFYLPNIVRYGKKGAEVVWLAKQAFAGIYGVEDVDKWFGVFGTRFIDNQWKREPLPNGPKIGTVSLSPRGDWRMPPDGKYKL